MGEAEEVRLEVEPGAPNLKAGSRKLTAGSWSRKLAAGSWKLLDSVLAVLVAPTCAVCGKPLEHPLAGAVCAACWNSITPITPPVCDGCGDPLPSWRIISRAEGCCPRCRRSHSHVTRSRAIGPYEGTLRALVHALKYDGRRSLARPLGERLARAGADLLRDADLVVPVPLHRARQRRRGFNQALEIAAHLGAPVANALRRTRATPSQADLPAARRHANVRGAFSLRRGADVSGKIVVLVDDVSTTGATLDACAGALIDAGAREVRALTAARVVSQPR